MRIIFLVLTLTSLVGCKSEDVSAADAVAIVGIEIPSNLSGVPSVN
jgi:hypothetical protein